MADPFPSMSENTKGLPSIMQPHPQPQSQRPLILPSPGHPIDLESTDGSGRGSPIQTASMASPLPPNSLTRAAIEAHLQAFNHNSITSSPSHMPEITLPCRPKPQRLLTDDVPAPSSDMLLIDDFPLPPAAKRADIPVLVDYSALIKPSPTKETTLGCFIRPEDSQPVLGSPTHPAPFIILDMRHSDTISVLLTKIGNEVLNQPFLANERELAVQRLDKIQLCVVWIQGDRFGMTVLGDDEALSETLALMEKRGWKDNFALRVNDPYEKLKDLNVPKDVNVLNNLKEGENTDGKGKGKEKESSRRRGRSSVSRMGRAALVDGGVRL